MEPNTYEEFRKNLETKLNERDQKIRKKEELIKDINDFETLLPELEQVIKDLETQFESTKSEEVKKELNSYLKEREDYFDLIQTFRKDAAVITQNIEQEDQLIADFYKRREIEFNLQRLEKFSPFEPMVSIQGKDGSMVNVAESNAALYQVQLKEYEYINNKIIKDYEEYESEEVVESLEEEIVPSFKRDQTEEQKELEIKRDTLLKELTEIEKEKGKKSTFEYTYKGEKRRVSIPKRLSGKYKYLLSQLKGVENALADYIPVVKFEKVLYDSMTVEQQKSYLANLMLQIEVRAENTLNKVYVQGKYIPREYQSLYENIIRLLKRDSKYTKSYSYPIDWPLVSEMTVRERAKYFENLMQKYLEVGKDSGVEITIKDKTYKVKEEDVPAFKTCREEYQKSRKELNQTAGVVGISLLEKKETDPDYYLHMMDTIAKKEWIDPVNYTVENVTYTVDKQMEEPFLDAAKEYDDLVNKEKKQTKVTKKARPFNLANIKKQIKKNAVKIMLGAAAIIAVVAKGYNMLKNHQENLEQTKIESVNDTLASTLFENIKITPEMSTPELTQEVKEILSETKETIQSLKKEEQATRENMGSFTLRDNNGYANVVRGGEEEEVKLKYPTDEYRIVTRSYEMPNGEIQAVNLESEEALQKISEIESLGGVLKTVDAVAQSGEEDYLKNHIPTATFTVNDQLNPTGLGRGR